MLRNASEEHRAVAFTVKPETYYYVPTMRQYISTIITCLLLCYQGQVIASEATQNQDNNGPQPEHQNDKPSPSPYRVTLWDPQNGEDSARLWSQTKLMFGLGVGVAGFIALLPEEISNWDTDKYEDGLMQRWWDNVREGPVWDEDHWAINYIGHPYFGGVYYQVARKSGYSQWDSFSYSALMSTFYWEYGLEAFAEVPSIQDLVVTPVGGWIYGEWAHQTEKEIVANGGTVWGSEGWGSTALFFLDPVEKIGIGINNMLGKELIKTGTGMISPHPTYFDAVAGESYDGYWGMDMVFTF